MVCIFFKFINSLSAIEIIGILLGMISLAYSHVIYKKQSKSQNIMDKFVKDTLSQLRNHEQTAYALLVHLRNENIKFQYQRNPNENYWYFKWRFETWNQFTVGIEINENTSSALVIEILGTTEDFKNNSFEGSPYIYYICKIIQSETRNFRVEEKVACFAYNNKIYLSREIGRFTVPERRFEITLVGLGAPDFAQGGDIPINEVAINERAKDFTIK